MHNKLLLQLCQLRHPTTALKLEHWKDLLVAAGNRLLLVPVRGADAKHTPPVRVPKKLILQPHLAGLGQRPHQAAVRKSRHGMRILARCQNRQARLCRNFLVAPLNEEVTQTADELVVGLRILHVGSITGRKFLRPPWTQSTTLATHSIHAEQCTASHACILQSQIQSSYSTQLWS